VTTEEIAERVAEDYGTLVSAYSHIIHLCMASYKAGHMTEAEIAEARKGMETLATLLQEPTE